MLARYLILNWPESSVKNQSTRQSNWLSKYNKLSMYIVMRQTIRRAAFGVVECIGTYGRYRHKNYSQPHMFLLVQQIIVMHSE